jgi:hypothetical protein
MPARAAPHPWGWMAERVSGVVSGVREIRIGGAWLICGSPPVRLSLFPCLNIRYRDSARNPEDDGADGRNNYSDALRRVLATMGTGLRCC